MSVKNSTRRNLNIFISKSMLIGHNNSNNSLILSGSEDVCMLKVLAPDTSKIERHGVP